MGLRVRFDVCPECMARLKRLGLSEVVRLLKECPKCRPMAANVQRAIYVDRIRKRLNL